MTVVDTEPMRELAYVPSDDTQALRAAVREWVAKHAADPRRVAQRLGDEPWDPDMWREIAGGLGVGAVLLPEEQGGLDAGYEAVAASFEELGRGLLTTPILGSLAFGLGALLPLVGSSPVAAQLAGQVAAGDSVVALAVADRWGNWHGDRPVATAPGDGYVLHGHAGVVVDAPRADPILVFAQASGALGLYVTRRDDLSVQPRPTLDPSREIADLTFDGTPARLLADGEAAESALRHTRILARVAVAAESVGGAEAALAEAVRYALARHQFGRPIAGFQAVKHMCADALLAIQEAKAVLSYATWALDDASPEAERALLAAKIATTDAYVAAAERAVQIFGAMGTTREVSVQVHFRRARFLSLVLDSNDDDRDLLAAQLGLCS